MAPDMTAKPIHRRSKPAVAVIAAGALLVATGVGDAASAPIYKCLGSNLGLIYTDQPCKDGERLDIHAGDADPAAAARLQDARDQLDKSAAARIVEERRVAAQRDFVALLRQQRDEDISAASVSDYSTALSPYDYSMLWYPGFVPSHPPRPLPHPPRPAPRSFAPNPPYIVPRS